MEGDDSTRISRVSGEFSVASVEHAFLESQLDDLTRKLRVAAAFVLILSPVYIVIDWLNAGLGTPFFQLVALRVVMTLAGLWLIVRRIDSQQRLAATALWGVAVVFVAYAGVNAVYLSSGVNTSLLVRWLWIGVMVLINYVYVPHRFAHALITSIGVSLLVVAIEVALGTLPTRILISVVLAMTGVHFFGVQFARVANRSRRLEFRLLGALFPADVVARVKRGEPVAEQLPDVSVLFADIVGFTELASRVEPTRLVAMLDELFQEFDALVERHGAEKIKTIGDCYMAAAGAPRRREDHAHVLARLALDMQALIRERSFDGHALQIRVGVHSGPLLAGVIGRKRQLYDLWGDTVNTASRMESHGVAGAIQVSARTRELLVDAFTLRERGEIPVKGKGTMTVFLLEGARVRESA